MSLPNPNRTGDTFDYFVKLVEAERKYRERNITSHFLDDPWHDPWLGPALQKVVAKPIESAKDMDDLYA